MSKWPARKVRDQWEDRLKEFGLSEVQIRRSDTVELACNANAGAVAFDPEWDARNTWKMPAQYKGYTMGDLRNTHLVSQRHAPREVPEWSRDSSMVRSVLLKKYPHLDEIEPGADSKGRRRSGADRRNAQRASLVIYYCWRLLWSDQEAAEALGVARATVIANLQNLKKTARLLGFEETNAPAESAK